MRCDTYRAWPPAEVAWLKRAAELQEKGIITVLEIALHLDRTTKSVKRRLAKLRREERLSLKSKETNE